MSHASASRGPARPQIGTSFIEVTTVVLVLAVLIAIGIPAFLGSKARASDRDAQTSLRIALSNAKAVYADTDSYSKVTVTALHAAETGIGFTTAASTGPKLVSVDASAAGVILAAKSPSGTCYVIGDAGSASGTVFGSLGTASCNASSVPTLPASVPSALHITDGGGWAQAW